MIKIDFPSTTYIWMGSLAVFALACRQEEGGTDALVTKGLSTSCVHAMPDQYVSTVALIDTSKPTESFCTGVLVSDNRVATSQHCFFKERKSIQVVLHPNVAAATAAHRKPALGVVKSPNQDVAMVFIDGIPKG